MLIYEILLNEKEEHDGETITLNKLAHFQRVNYPNEPLSVPKVKPIKHVIPEDLEIEEITREISKADDIKTRGKGW